MIGTTTYRLHFPRDLTPDQVLGLLLAINGTSTVQAAALRFSVRGNAGRLEHRLELPHARSGLVAQLPELMPGLRLDVEEASRSKAGLPSYAWQLWQSSSRRPLRSDHPELTSRAVLTALQAVRGTEWLELGWVLGPVRRPLSVGSRHAGVLSESWPLALATAAVRPPGDLDADARQALRLKRREPAWRALGQLVVNAADRKRARSLVAGLTAAIRTSEGPGVRFGVRRSHPRRLRQAPLRWPLQLNAVELVGLLAWPLVGAAQELPVDVERARQLEVRHTQPRRGRTIGRSPAGTSVRLSDVDSLRHLLITGPTGTGKSTLIMRLLLQDIAAGHSVVLLDPKGDLVDDVLARYPENRQNELVVIDPRDVAPVGVNPLYRPTQPALVADQLLGIFTQLFKDSFGPRTADVLGASLLTLARWGEGSLAVLPLLLTNPGLRRRIVGGAPDPLGTGPFWAWYERLKDAERQQIIAPSLNKLRAFTVRPDLRAVLGQVEPRFALTDLIRGRRVVLINLAKGALGPESSALLGTLLLNQIWQTLQGRGDLPPERRHRVGLYVDEIAGYLRLPGDVSELLIQARSLGVGFTLAHQHLHQLPNDLRAAVLANARSRILFQLESDDARVFAAGHPELEAADLSGLAPYQVYAGLLQDNQVQPYVSLKLPPPAPPSRSPADLRTISRGSYGRSRLETDAALEALVEPPETELTPVGRRPRRPS